MKDLIFVVYIYNVFTKLNKKIDVNKKRIN